MKIAVFPGLLRLVVVAAVLAGCSGNPDKDRADRPENPFKSDRSGPGGPKAPLSDKELRLAASQLYKRAVQSLEESDFSTAIERYNQLIARYPFSDYSTQAELEKIYAQYRNFQSDEAVTAADRFLREHPRHPAADYVQYVKGLTNSSRDESFSDFLPIDTAKKDVTNERRAYDDFALLLQRYPNSRYAGDTRRRMVYLRNRVADHDLSIVRFYVKRGAYVAAAKRAESIIAEYPGAPATAEALRLLESSDRKIGLTREADEMAALIAANPDTFAAAAAKPAKHGKKDVPTLAANDTRVVPVVGAPPEAAPPTVVDAPPPRRSFTQRFVSMFDFLDTSKPENTYTVVVPTGSAATAATPPASASGSDAAATTAAPATAANSGNAEAAYGSAAPVAASPSAPGTRLHASVDYGDATDSTEKTTSTAPSAGTPVAAPAPASSEPAKSTTAAAATPAKSRGFLERFVDFFSFLDPNRNGSESATPPPSTGKIDNTGDKVPATTPDK